MAESFYTKRPQSDAAGMAAGMANGGPPPSTLAAQLVENISVSNKSSRSDENTELRRLFATIERVKDDPELLKTASERIEHNHMLIYVYSRVVLDNLKLDSPFVQRDHVRSEALKAINFLRFTVKETPAVLLHSIDSHGLLYRGQEPLWIWLLPHLLKLLGHAECLDIEGAMEGFLQYLWLLVSRNTVLWELSSSLSLYLRSILSGEYLSSA
jgi:serine/threonine-protein kinase ATR